MDSRKKANDELEMRKKMLTAVSRLSGDEYKSKLQKLSTVLANEIKELQKNHGQQLDFKAVIDGYNKLYAEVLAKELVSGQAAAMKQSQTSSWVVAKKLASSTAREPKAFGSLGKQRLDRSNHNYGALPKVPDEMKQDSEKQNDAYGALPAYPTGKRVGKDNKNDAYDALPSYPESMGEKENPYNGLPAYPGEKSTITDENDPYRGLPSFPGTGPYAGLPQPPKDSKVVQAKKTTVSSPHNLEQLLMGLEGIIGKAPKQKEQEKGDQLRSNSDVPKPRNP